MSMQTDRIIALFKCLFAACIFSGIILILFSLLWLLFPKASFLGSIAKILMYCASGFFCGYLFSRGAKSKKYLWGLLSGLCYVLLISLLSFIQTASMSFLFTSPFLTGMLLCLSGGMLGGMLSK